jgi:hypothetical protein
MAKLTPNYSMAELPAALQQVQVSLEPYIKKRQDVSKIRQVLSSHLFTHLNSTDGPTVNRPLSLIEAACIVEPPTHGARGLQKEYLRCARANLKARTEYTVVSNEHRVTCNSQSDIQDVQTEPNTSLGMEVFIHLNSQQQKHDCLCIIQDYIETMSQKPAAAAEHLNPKVALRDVESLPKVPSEVLDSTSASSNIQGVDLKVLVDQLEKSVLRAKLLLKREQKLLAKLRSESHISSADQGDRLPALGLTRNELINWIETEMEKAGDGPVEVDDEELSSRDVRGKDYIESQLASIQRQYVRYIDARQALITSTAAISDSTTSTVEAVSELQDQSGEFHQLQSMQIMYPYLEKMVFTASRQKVAIQQRSHLTISLAKQIKEATQGLDRLTDESHLLSAHPMPTSISQRKGLEGPLSFNDELLQHEKPDSSNRASAWVFAAESSAHAIKDAIAEQLESGGTALEDAQHSLSEMCHLLGHEGSVTGTIETQKQDIWTVLNGSLGVIKSDEVK